MQSGEVQHVFLVGAKSLGAYGGYETFVNKLTEYHQNNPQIKYHVACKANGDGSMNPYKTSGAQIINDHEFTYHNAHCFRVKIPEKLGPAQAIYYDVAALHESCEIIKRDKIPHPIVYIMACRIGPFIKHYYHEIHKLEGKVYLNLDGQDRRPGEGRARSDAMIIASINKTDKTIKLTSLMRDMYVQIPGYSDNRINAAYAFGGMELLDAAIKQNFDIDIDGNIEVDFSGFKNVIDSIGSVDIQVDADEISVMNDYVRDINRQTGAAPDSSLVTQAGMQHLNGT